jgi:hypothetical protein
MRGRCLLGLSIANRQVEGVVTGDEVEVDRELDPDPVLWSSADFARALSADPTPYFEKYGENVWAAFKGGLAEMAATAAAPVIQKYTGVLAAADAFTESTTFHVMHSIRLDLGHSSCVHP